MARRIRDWDPKRYTPTSAAAANQAISDWTAAYITEKRIKGLGRQVRKAETAVKLSGQSAEAQAKAAARFGQSLQGGANALTDQSNALSNLLRQRDAAIERFNRDLKAGKGPEGYGDWTKKQRERWYDWKVKTLAESRAYRLAAKDYEASHRQYLGQTRRLDTLNDRIKRANKRTQRLQRRYIAAYKRYKASEYVPYSPA